MNKKLDEVYKMSISKLKSILNWRYVGQFFLTNVIIVTVSINEINK